MKRTIGFLNHHPGGNENSEIFLAVFEAGPAEELAVAAGEIEIGPHENMGESPFHPGPPIIGLDPLNHGLPEGPLRSR